MQIDQHKIENIHTFTSFDYVQINIILIIKITHGSWFDNRHRHDRTDRYNYFLPSSRTVKHCLKYTNNYLLIKTLCTSAQTPSYGKHIHIRNRHILTAGRLKS